MSEILSKNWEAWNVGMAVWGFVMLGDVLEVAAVTAEYGDRMPWDGTDADRRSAMIFEWDGERRTARYPAHYTVLPAVMGALMFPRCECWVIE